MTDTQEALEARDNLRWVAARWPALRSHLAPTNGNSARHTPTPKSKPPLAIYVLDLMHQIETHTHQYVHQLANETHDWKPTTNHTPTLLENIAHRHGHWTASDNEDTVWAFCDWAHDTAEKVRRITEQPPPATWIGPCPNINDPDNRCAGHIYQRGTKLTTCPECGTAVDVDERKTWLRKQLDLRLMSRKELLAALTILEIPVNPRTLDKWIERAHLEPAVTTITPHVYRFRKARELAERLHHRRNIRHAAEATEGALVA